MIKIHGSSGIEFPNNYSLKSDSGDLTVMNDVNKLWGMNSAGYESNPNVPAFLAQAVESDTTYSNQLVPYPTPLLNNGSHYNSSTSIFTAPIGGIYCFSWSTWKNFTGTGRTYIQINGGYYTGYGTTKGIHARTSENDNTDYASATVLINLNAGDYVNIYDGPNSTGTRIFFANYFGGYLIG